MKSYKPDWKIYLLFILNLLCLGNSNPLFSQNNSDDIIRKQRVLFVYNLAQQIVWDGISTNEKFTIGIFGQDPSIVDFKAMSRSARKILGKSVEIVRINSINSSLNDIDLLYINDKYYNTTYPIIGRVIAGKKLLITEDFDKDPLMINMVRDQDAYAYQINEANINRAGLVVASTLNTGAVKDSNKWLDLYKEKEKELSIVEEQNENQKEIIQRQIEVIDSKEEVITSKENSIRKLITKSDNISNKLKKQLELEKLLEERITSQKDHINSQLASMDSIKKHINVQQEILQNQTEEIHEKEEVLGERAEIIENQKRLIRLILGLLLLSAVFVGIISFGLYKYRKLNKLLNAQKIEIEQNAKLLKAKNRELEQFAYITSHDLQEPLNSISSFIDLLQEEYQDKFDNEGNTILGFIKEGSVRMGRLINALLQYSRLGRNRDFKVINSNKLLENVQFDINNMVQESNAKIIVGDLPDIYGNEVEIGLLFQNIISNAIKFRKKDVDPIVTIKGEEELYKGEEYFKFSISDNGIGIKEEHLERIFGIFQRLHSREDYKGSGIGLAHCEKIIKSHNGNLWLRSELGKGSTFFFSIPKRSTEDSKLAA